MHVCRQWIGEIGSWRDQMTERGKRNYGTANNACFTVHALSRTLFEICYMLLSILLFNFQHGLLLWYSCWTQEFLVSNCSGNLILNNLVRQWRKAGGSQAAEVSLIPWHAVLIIALLQFAVHRNQGIYESLKGAGDREVIIMAFGEITGTIRKKKKKKVTTLTPLTEYKCSCEMMW